MLFRSDHGKTTGNPNVVAAISKDKVDLIDIAMVLGDVNLEDKKSHPSTNGQVVSAHERAPHFAPPP